MTRVAKEAEVSTRGRGGRPPADQAGDVDRRIVEAATAMFLQAGFDATSCERIAADAGAGKASLYARYPNKEALFEAVVRNMVERMDMPVDDLPWGLPVEDRLRAVGRLLLSNELSPSITGLTRIVVSVAPRMPKLAKFADTMGKASGMRLVTAALAGKNATTEAIERAMPAADRFIDLTFAPHQMRALLGDDADALAHDVPRRVDEAVSFLAAAGWLASW